MSGRRVARVLGVVVALAVPAAVAASVVSAAQDRVSTVASAWIDDPLDRTEVPLAPLEIVAHATSLDGLARLELIVDDVVVDDAPGGSGLVLGRWTWTPPAAGAHRIVVRGVETESSYVDSAMVTVFVGGAPDVVAPGPAPTTVPVTTSAAPTTAPVTSAGTTAPTVTTPPTAATTAPPTTRRTTVPTTAPPTTTCEVEPPVPFGPTGGNSVADRTPHLSWGQPGDCPVASWFVEVSRDAGFARTETSGSSESEGWTVSEALENCTTFYWHVRANTARASGPWSDTVSFRVDVGGC